MIANKIFRISKKAIVKGIVPIILTGSLYAENTAKPNPYLSAPLYGITHFDSSQSDSFPYQVNKGDYSVNLQNMKKVTGGPINIITLASTSPDYMWGVSTQGVTYINIANGEFKEVARLNVPGMAVITPEQHKEVLNKKYKSVTEVEDAIKNIYKIDNSLARIANGTYNVADSNNTVYANFLGSSIYAFSLIDKNNPSKGIKIDKILDAKGFLQSNEHIEGISMTYDGKIIVVGTHSVTVVGRDFKNPVTAQFESDEAISNSIAVDEKNAIYVASDKYMRKVVWTGTKLSQDEKDGAWKTAYDTGQQPPSVKFGKGTGSTPTLMGFGSDEDKLVVITDGANRMNIVAFWRDEIPAGFKQKPGTKSNRIADQMPITAGQPKTAKWIQSEQSVVVKGYGAFVVNNIVDKAPDDRLVGVIALGPVIKPPVGVERVQWDPKTDSWKSVWARGDVSSISMVPSVSAGSNIVFVNGYVEKTGWEVTGLDWDNGKTVYRAKFGFDNYGNGAYAIVQFLPNGDLLFNSIAGPVRVTTK
ncbi:hypothetical protein [Sebaldella sp. S0638]|uniref:hypothetical protein n=1 Tax=Sebaldella sp. S0638 TaxID=2957809 RepID=UPI00209F4056|nr:hypothetical protein [Sebaldella sp. S0638]MCP1226200.1 hypothetical protein [Sebaldella sp. S0638]